MYDGHELQHIPYYILWSCQLLVSHNEKTISWLHGKRSTESVKRQGEKGLPLTIICKDYPSGT